MKPPICVDFDGVLNNYAGYDGENLGTIKHGAKEFLQKLNEEYTVTILTVRGYEPVMKWLDENQLLEYVDFVTKIKPPAVAYIDDRAVCFKGDYKETLEELKGFKTYWEEKSDA